MVILTTLILRINLEYTNNKLQAPYLVTGRSSLFSHYYFIVGILSNKLKT